MENQVCLSVGRHEDYANGIKTALKLPSMVAAYLSGSFLEEKVGKIGIIWSSEIPRAQTTAELRASACGCRCLKREQFNEFNAYQTRDMLLGSVDSGRRLPAQHVHVVTHFPNLERVFNFEVNKGETVLVKADNWDDVFELMESKKLISKKDVEVVSLPMSQMRLQQLVDNIGIKSNTPNDEAMEKIVSYFQNNNDIKSLDAGMQRWKECIVELSGFDCRFGAENSLFFDIVKGVEPTSLKDIVSIAAINAGALRHNDLELLNSLSFYKDIESYAGHVRDELFYDEHKENHESLYIMPYHRGETKIFECYVITENVKFGTDILKKTEEGLFCIQYVEKLPNHLHVPALLMSRKQSEFEGGGEIPF